MIKNNWLAYRQLSHSGYANVTVMIQLHLNVRPARRIKVNIRRTDDDTSRSMHINLQFCLRYIALQLPKIARKHDASIVRQHHY